MEIKYENLEVIVRLGVIIIKDIHLSLEKSGVFALIDHKNMEFRVIRCVTGYLSQNIAYSLYNFFRGKTVELVEVKGQGKINTITNKACNELYEQGYSCLNSDSWTYKV